MHGLICWGSEGCYFLDILKGGFTLKDLIEAALELFAPHPGVESRKETTRILEEEFKDALSDVNISCLVVAKYSGSP
ncbi:MAG: hypothetical protein QW335_08205 [Candidatus Nezhaarchaeales archaeon]